MGVSKRVPRMNWEYNKGRTVRSTSKKKKTTPPEGGEKGEIKKNKEKFQKTSLPLDEGRLRWGRSRPSRSAV